MQIELSEDDLWFILNVLETAHPVSHREMRAAEALAAEVIRVKSEKAQKTGPETKGSENGDGSENGPEIPPGLAAFSEQEIQDITVMASIGLLAIDRSPEHVALGINVAHFGGLLPSKSLVSSLKKLEALDLG